MQNSTKNNNELEFDHRMTDESRAYVREFLKIAKSADITKMDLAIARKLKDENAEKLNSQFKFENLIINELRVKNPMDNYEIKVVKYESKEKKDENTPVTVFFHGGGYSLGSTVTHHLTVANLATKTRSIWLSVDYRLCPEHKYPTPFIDCKSVVEWAYENK